MDIRVIGSGDAFCSGAQANSCYWLEGKACGQILVDCGVTTLLRLQQEGLQPQDLDAVLITHLHGDHYGGLPMLILEATFAHPRKTQLPIIGPVGLEEALEELMYRMYPDVMSGTIPGPQPVMPFDVYEIMHGEEVILAGYEICGLEAAHMQAECDALSYTITRAGDPKSPKLFFSGDTEMNPLVADYIQKADLAVVECTTLTPTRAEHCSWAELSELLPTLPADHRVVLSHLGPEVRAKAAELTTPAPCRCTYTFAKDGDRFHI